MPLPLPDSTMTVSQNSNLCITLSLSPWKVTRVLTFVVLSLVLLSLLSQCATYFLPDFPGRDTFDLELNVDKEGNIPSLYSGLSLLFCSALLFIIFRVSQQQRRSYLTHWKVLSFIFAYLALDEWMSWHERLIEPVRDGLGLSGFLYFAWVVPAFFLLILFFLSYARFWLHLPQSTRRLFLVAVILFVGGALCMELIGARYTELYGQENIGYQLWVTLEEMLEMLGIVVFIHALIQHLNRLKFERLSMNIFVNSEY